MAFPQSPLDATVELAIGADIHADPSTWSWTDVTASIRERQKVVIDRGRRNRVGNFPPTRVSATADNRSGDLCRHNPNGAYFGQLKKNTPMRVRVDNGSGPVTRAAVYVPGFPPSWDVTGRNHIVTLQAVGITDRLGRSKPLRSAMFRTMSGVAPDDYVPAYYWSMEDGSGATQFASGLPGGTAISIPADVTPSADSSIVGSDALPTFAAAAVVTSPAISYTDTGQWVFQFTHRTDAFPATETVYARINLAPGGTLAYIEVSLDVGIAGSPVTVRVRGYDSTGTAHGTLNTFDLLTVGGDAEGDPLLITVAFTQTGGGLAQLSVGVATASASSGITSVSTSGTATAFTGFQLRAGLACTFGHATLFTDPSIVLSGGQFNREALGGWAGEMAHERAERLCREERVPFTTTATTSQAMGPQSSGRLLDLLRECANADQGLLFEDMNFGLTYVSSSERYNLAAAITLQYDQRGILPPWEPDDDDQDYYNEVTATRPGGSSATEADRDEIDDVGQFADSINPNVETDDQLNDVAGWRLNLGLNDELTWPAVRPNLYLGGALLDAWLDTDLGQHMHITGHPSPLAPDTIRQVIEGYSETLGAKTYAASVNLSPASPWDVAELDDDDLGKLDTAGCVMQAGATDSATSFTVATTVLPKWTTDAGEMPIPILVSGQVNSVTAVSNVSPSFVAAGTVAHASNASVTPTMPAGVQAGDLLLVLAAIRNSGTGTVNTPSGYTVLLTSGNMTLLGKVHTGTESAPQITFTGGVANADTSAQMAAFRGVGITVHDSEVQLNSSAQNIAYPQLDVSRDNCAVIYLGWKQDDWTSVASPGTEIGEPDTTTGDDQGIVWAYTLQTTAARIASGSFTVTGGVSAISRGGVVALATDVQTMTVTRGTNGVTKAIPIGSQVNVYRPARLAL